MYNLKLRFFSIYSLLLSIMNRLYRRESTMDNTERLNHDSKIITFRTLAVYN
jgi:hypothetical protein